MSAYQLTETFWVKLHKWILSQISMKFEYFKFQWNFNEVFTCKFQWDFNEVQISEKELKIATKNYLLICIPWNFRKGLNECVPTRKKKLSLKLHIWYNLKFSSNIFRKLKFQNTNFRNSTFPFLQFSWKSCQQSHFSEFPFYREWTSRLFWPIIPF